MEAENKIKREIPESKKRTLKEIIDLMKKNNTVMIVSTRNLPSSKLQSLRKDLKNVAIRVIKKNLMLKALEDVKNAKLKELESYLVENFAVLFSERDPYEISILLNKARAKVPAKAGQTSPFDIVVEAGPTDLMPMFMSDLTNVGIKAKIESGKVVVKEPMAIIKKGDKIKLEQAELLLKLSIEPFTVELVPIAAFDAKNNVIYKELKIDTEGTLNKLKAGSMDAFKLAMKAVFPIRETIKFLLAKALSHANALQGKTASQTSPPSTSPSESP